MAHDLNGDSIKTGDVVSVCFKVITSIPNEDYVNCFLESVLPVYPSDTEKLYLNINGRQSQLQTEGEL